MAVKKKVVVKKKGEKKEKFIPPWIKKAQDDKKAKAKK